MIKRIILSIIGLMLLISIASATSSLTIGSLSYSSSVLKDESFTISTSIEAASVSSTTIVTVTLSDNTNAVAITSAVTTLTFTSAGTQNVQWSVTANNPGTYTNPFTITATASDSGTASPKTATTSISIKDRPVLFANVSQNDTSISPDGYVQLNYVLTNVASAEAGSATNINASLTTIPDGWTPIITTTHSISSLSAGGSQTSGYFIVKAPSTPGSYDLNMTIISAQGESITKGWTVTVESIETATPVLTTITVSPATATLTIGGTQVFNATAKDQNGTVMEGINITWASKNTSIGTVTPQNALTGSNGNATVTLTALTAGTVIINATNASKVANATVIIADYILNLSTGWNLVSVPFGLTNTSPFTGFTVLYYNVSAGIPESDPTIEPLKSYWVNNSESEVVRIGLINNSRDGAGPSKAISLANGWNMVGPTGMVSKNASLMFGSVYTNLWRVAGYNSTGDAYEIFTNSDTAVNNVSVLVTEPTVGYWVLVTGDSMYDGDGSIR
ncbi:MAG: Ig-like domain-containing protein [Candidatus Methanoperedens sp.]|nr:Ig-like domain-containing protein [Candidatus Methanoperedens sp.]CAG0976673.1 hypothetical protein METP1_01541 [Methanosarcinales archaeon]